MKRRKIIKSGRNMPPSRQSGIDGVKGHNMKRNYLTGKARPVVGMLQFRRSVERSAIKKSSKAIRAIEEPMIHLTVNGQRYDLEVGNRPDEIDPSHTLAYTLRETLGLTGTKIGCDHGACGSCTILMDGRAVLSCMILTIEADGKNITTIEGLRDPNTGKLDILQQAFIDHTAFQCGFCTPGILMSAKALLNENVSPKEQDVKEALSGNYCRCISHYHVLDAVMAAAQKGGIENGGAV